MCQEVSESLDFDETLRLREMGIRTPQSQTHHWVVWGAARVQSELDLNPVEEYNCLLAASTYIDFKQISEIN